jgi:hypothetical protein
VPEVGIEPIPKRSSSRPRPLHPRKTGDSGPALVDGEDRRDGVQGQIGDSGLSVALAEAQTWARRWSHLAELRDVIAAIVAADRNRG